MGLSQSKSRGSKRVDKSGQRCVLGYPWPGRNTPDHEQEHEAIDS